MSIYIIEGKKCHTLHLCNLCQEITKIAKDKVNRNKAVSTNNYNMLHVNYVINSQPLPYYFPSKKIPLIIFYKNESIFNTYIYLITILEHIP